MTAADSVGEVSESDCHPECCVLTQMMTAADSVGEVSESGATGSTAGGAAGSPSSDVPQWRQQLSVRKKRPPPEVIQGMARCLSERPSPGVIQVTAVCLSE